jgi:hypothetical protein
VEQENILGLTGARWGAIMTREPREDVDGLAIVVLILSRKSPRRDPCRLVRQVKQFAG